MKMPSANPNLALLVDQLVSNDSAWSIVQDWSHEKAHRVVLAMVEAGMSVPTDGVSAVLRSPGIVDTIQAAMLRREFAAAAPQTSAQVFLI